MIDSDEDVVNEYRYTPFGEALENHEFSERVRFGKSDDFPIENESVFNPYQFTGRRYDEESGLYYYRARMYSAEQARFTSNDPAKDGDNWYAYVGNNPVNSRDSSGKIGNVAVRINMIPLFGYQSGGKPVDWTVCMCRRYYCADEADNHPAGAGAVNWDCIDPCVACIHYGDGESCEIFYDDFDGPAMFPDHYYNDCTWVVELGEAQYHEDSTSRGGITRSATTFKKGTYRQDYSDYIPNYEISTGEYRPSYWGIIV